MSSVTPIQKKLSTEEKILNAAREVFTQKGYAATRTRDIAEKAGINLALLNYYFRSKEKLFEQVMMEQKAALLGRIYPIVSNSATSLEEKVDLIIETYFDVLTKTPELPLFVLGEMQKDPSSFAGKLPLKQMITESSFAKQLKETKPDIDPINMIWNIFGLTIFPFISKPIFINSDLIDTNQFNELINERRTLVPIWIKNILYSK